MKVVAIEVTKLETAEELADAARLIVATNEDYVSWKVSERGVELTDIDGECIEFLYAEDVLVLNSGVYDFYNAIDENLRGFF